MNKPLATLVLAVSLAALQGCEMHPVQGDIRIHDRDLNLRVVFTDQDRRLLRDYYYVDYRALPPGLAKKGKVPPGHAYRIQRNQPLPPGIGWTYLPAQLERQLSRLPDGYVRILIGGSVAILHVRTRVVVDLIEDLGD